MFRKSISFAVFIAVLIVFGTIAVPAQAQETPNFLAGKDTLKPVVFKASLTGSQEVPPVETDARGYSIFAIKKGAKLAFNLRVANIEDVFAAHIHCAPMGVNGPVGVTLYGGDTVSIEKGSLAGGAISGPDDGNACGWEDLGDVLAAFQEGEAYVNVHTSAYPSGEIRGQIH